jgi:hypothetical protein
MLRFYPHPYKNSLGDDLIFARGLSELWVGLLEATSSLEGQPLCQQSLWTDLTREEVRRNRVEYIVAYLTREEVSHQQSP